MSVNSSHATKSILILQGGGALGAYECGVFEALLPHLNDLAVVAGTSIGAVNAGVIARHYSREDGGKAAFRALMRLWTEKLTNPPWRFPVPIDQLSRLNARAIGALGHPHLYAVRPSSQPPWLFNPIVPWSDVGFCDIWPLEDTLADPQIFGSYGHDRRFPRLLVTAVDIEAGRSRAFDSWQERITPEKVAACGSLPPNFVPKDIREDGKVFSYWDGGIWNNTPLRDVLNALQGPDTDAEQTSTNTYEVYIVDVFHRRGHRPQNLMEVFQRKFELEFADKTEYEVKVCGWVNDYLDLVTALERYKGQLPPPLQSKIEAILQRRLADGKDNASPVRNRFHLNITTIQRSDFPGEQDEQLSSAADFSPERIEELMKQGREHARKVLHRS